MVRRIFLVASAFLIGALSCKPATPPAQLSLPAAPRYYVLDQSHTFSSKRLRTVQSILVEHDRLTGEQVMIGIFRGTSDDIKAHASRVFNQWQVGRPGRNAGVLLAVYPETKQASVLVGFALEALLPDNDREKIEDTLRSHLDPRERSAAISTAVVDVLRLLESPVTGKAKTLLGVPDTEETEEAPPISFFAWGLAFFLGLLLILSVLYFVTASETHYTGQGWFRPKPWELWKDQLKNRRKSSANRALDEPLGGIDGSW